MKPILAAYLNPNEVAAYSSLGKSTLAKMRMRGDSPEFIKIGASVRYPREGFDAWMAHRRQRSTSETPARRHGQA